jgi:hypothetical protein
LDVSSIPWTDKEIRVRFNSIAEAGEPLSKYDRNAMEMDISTYQIRHILRTYTEQLKPKQIDIAKSAIFPNSLQNELNLSSDGKKKQFIDQLISEAVVRLATGVGKENTGRKNY